MRARRSAHTLFEMILVMAVLVIVGFISFPMIQPMFGSSRTQAAADLVRTRWMEMRMRAMSEARPYSFGFMENTGNFRIAPDSPELWGESGGPGGSADTGEGDQPWILEEELPDEVLFTRAGSGDLSSAPTSGSGWTKALTFLPDGTSRQDVEIAFGKAGSRSMTLKLRGVTGAVSTGDGPGEGNRP